MVDRNFTGLKVINEDKLYYLNGQLHRDNDQPAMEFISGYKVWCINGRIHRNVGPAIIYTNGRKDYYRNGRLHRLDGPAIEYADGMMVWYIDGTEYKDSDFTQAALNFAVDKQKEVIIL